MFSWRTILFSWRTSNIFLRKICISLDLGDKGQVTVTFFVYFCSGSRTSWKNGDGSEFLTA